MCHLQFPDTLATPCHPRVTSGPPHWQDRCMPSPPPFATHARLLARPTGRTDVCPPHALQGPQAAAEAAGVRDLRRSHPRPHPGDPARLPGHGMAVPRPRRPRLPNHTRRPRLRAHPDGRVAGQRLHDPSPPSCPGCPPAPAHGPPAPPKTRKLRLAGAAPPPGSPLRPRRTPRPPDRPHLPRLHRPHPQPPHPPTLARRTALAQPPSVTPSPGFGI